MGKSKAIYKLSILTSVVVFFAVTVRVHAQETGTWLKLPTNESMNVIITTPFAIYGGQYASKSWGNPYNGVYKSTDLGTTWRWVGLMNRGITDMVYDKGKIYTCTFYETAGTIGLFASSEEEINWQHLGPNYACLKATVSENNILIGTKYNGIWISGDGGNNFTQTLIVTGTDKDIIGLDCEKGICFAGTYPKTYRSLDAGKTWEEIPQLASKQAGYFGMYNSVVLAGTKYGLYRSTDSGATWNMYAPWGSAQIGNVLFYNKIAFATKKETSTQNQVYQSYDFGLNWESTNIVTPMNTPLITGLTWLYTKPAYLFSAGFGSGVQRYAIKPRELKTLAFFGPLWSNSNPTEQLQSITSYFDHSYPFLGYYLYSEPEAERSTTLNFLGGKETPPKLYYSSHDGYDFGLWYGTKILAPASGTAIYQYSPSGGHTIKIDHRNGYQTVYMHLQKVGLFTTGGESKWIDKGNQIGLVGLTGNTSGPHLHFSVTNDKKSDSNFLDDYPDGKTDPYSWQNEVTEDPWEIYTWNDGLGEHAGNESPLLWTSLPSPAYCYGGQFDTLTLEKSPVKLEIQAGSLPVPATIEMNPWTSFNSAYLENNLIPLVDTSFKLSALDHLKQPLGDFVKPVKIDYDLSNEILSGIDVQTLRVAFFNPISLLWESLPSIWNSANKKLSASTNHFSEFVVTGEKTDPNPPETNIAIAGKKEGVWYAESPVITLNADDGEDGSGVDKSFYSIDDGNTWEEYLAQTQVVKEGVYAVLYKSADKDQNYESAKDSPLLRVDTLGLYKDEIALSGAVFSVATE